MQHHLEFLLNSELEISLGYIVVTALTAELLRQLTLKYIKNSPDNGGNKRSLILEFIATFEFCATCFELGIVIQRQGFLAYGLIMLVLFNYWGIVWRGGCCAPHVFIVECLQRQSSLSWTLAKLGVQGVAAMFAFLLFTKPVWSFGFHSQHLQIVNSSECYTHLQVPVLFGVIVEALATLAFFQALRIFGRNKYSGIILPVILVTIVYCAIGFTGGYFNPILATAVQFGCTGITPTNHFLVYWLGPVLGCFGNTLLNNVIAGKTTKLQ